jgi:hypothetical protein
VNKVKNVLSKDFMDSDVEYLIFQDCFGEEKLYIQTVPGSGSPMSTDDESDTDADDNRNKHGHVAKHMRTDKVVVFWVSYMDGLQRVLLLTQDERVANKAKKVMLVLVRVTH